MCPKGYHSHIHANLPCPNITVCLPVMGELKCTGLTFFLPTMKLFLAFFTYCCYMELHGKNNKNKIYASSIMVNISEKSVRITIYNSIKPCNVTVPNKVTSQLVRKYISFTCQIQFLLAFGTWRVFILNPAHTHLWAAGKEKETEELFNNISIM